MSHFVDGNNRERLPCERNVITKKRLTMKTKKIHAGTRKALHHEIGESGQCTMRDWRQRRELSQNERSSEMVMRLRRTEGPAMLKQVATGLTSWRL